MIKAILLDDEPLALRQMEIYASKIPFMEVIAACTASSQARPFITDADVIFLDINMPDVNGLDFIRTIENPPLIVFTTAYSEYALEGYKVSAVDYLLKPFSFAEFKTAVQKVEKYKDLQHAAAPQEPAMSFQTGHKIVNIYPDKIRYIEGYGEYLKIWIDNQVEPTIILYRMGKLEQELPKGKFIRIHRSYIVPIKRILNAGTSTVTLDGSVILPIGGNYRTELREILLTGRA